MVYFFRINQLNMYVTEHALQKNYQLEIPQPAKYWYLLEDKHFMNTYTRLRELICINLYARNPSCAKIDKEAYLVQRGGAQTTPAIVRSNIT